MSVLLLTSLLGLVMSVDSAHISSFYSPAKGLVIKPGLRGSVISVRSKLDCIRSQCSGVKPCAVAFHRQSRQCMGVAAAQDLIPILLRIGFLFTTNGSEDGWTTFVSQGAEVKTGGPAALWMLDNESRGRNLGVKGERLDMDETGLTWSSTGPRGAASSHRYATFTTNNRAKVQLLHDGEYVLNLTQSFTMAMWMRTDDVTELMHIICGRIGSSRSMQIYFLNRYLTQIKIFLGPDFSSHSSTVNSTGRLDWRHVAAVFEGGKTFRFYLNGREWKIGGQYVDGRKEGAPQPESLEIGRAETDYMFRGSMACMCIYERALTAEEVAALMNACP